MRLLPLPHYLTSFLDRRKPAVLLAAITHRCNLRCKYCGLWEEQREELKTEEWCELLSEASRIGVVSVSFCGGEPLVREDVGILLRHAKKQWMRTSLTTNGVFVVERHRDLELLDAISLSLDGREVTHDSLRGKGTFRRVLEAIDWALKAKKKIYTVTVLTQDNIEDIPFVCHMAKSKGFLAFFQPATAYAFCGRHTEDLSLDQQTLRHVGEFLIRMKKDGLPVGNSLSYLRSLLSPLKPKVCSAGRRFLTVLPDAALVPCHILVSNEAPRWQKNALRSQITSIAVTQCANCRIAPYYEYDSTLSRFSIETYVNAVRVLF